MQLVPLHRGGDSAYHEPEQHEKRGEGVRLLRQQVPRIRRHGAAQGRRASRGAHGWALHVGIKLTHNP
jgi:hypothetical protein